MVFAYEIDVSCVCTVLLGKWCALAFLIFPAEKNEYSDYVQELKTLLATIQLDPLSEAVQVIISMNVLELGLPGRRIFVSILLIEDGLSPKLLNEK